jgi:hypothetical protein
MTNLQELEKTIDSLPQEDYRQFRRWFMEKNCERWDGEIAEDSRTGKLDFLIEEALDAKEKKKLRNL